MGDLRPVPDGAEADALRPKRDAGRIALAIAVTALSRRREAATRGATAVLAGVGFADACAAPAGSISRQSLDHFLAATSDWPGAFARRRSTSKTSLSPAPRPSVCSPSAPRKGARTGSPRTGSPRLTDAQCEDGERGHRRPMVAARVLNRGDDGVRRGGADLGRGGDLIDPFGARRAGADLQNGYVTVAGGHPVGDPRRRDREGACRERLLRRWIDRFADTEVHRPAHHH